MSDDSKWKTPGLPPDTALHLLDLHHQDHHGAAAPTAAVGGGQEGIKNKLVKFDKLKTTQHDFEFFKTELNTYYESTVRQSDKIIKDKL